MLILSDIKNDLIAVNAEGYKGYIDLNYMYGDEITNNNYLRKSLKEHVLITSYNQKPIGPTDIGDTSSGLDAGVKWIANVSLDTINLWKDDGVSKSIEFSYTLPGYTHTNVYLAFDKNATPYFTTISKDTNTLETKCFLYGRLTDGSEEFTHYEITPGWGKVTSAVIYIDEIRTPLLAYSEMFILYIADLSGSCSLYAKKQSDRFTQSFLMADFSNIRLNTYDGAGDFYIKDPSLNCIDYKNNRINHHITYTEMTLVGSGGV